MQQALTQTLHAGFAGHPLRQFVARAAELMLQAEFEAWRTRDLSALKVCYLFYK